MKSEQISRWVEILANLGVLITLVFLITEVQDNTHAVERQALMDRAAILNGPYLNQSLVPGILAKVKAVDGPEAVEQAYIDRYGLTYEEAGVWARYHNSLWNGLEADYARLGPNDDIADRVRILFQFPDVRLWWENGHATLLNPEFRAFVDAVRG